MLRSEVLSKALMADNPGVQIVEIRAGTSQRPVLELRPGQPVQPMSLGRVGMWPIEAPGVLDVHAYVYFDGRALFVQSADPNNPAKGNGQAIATAWQQVEIPCTLEMGRARLVYRTLDEGDADGEEDKTIAQAVKIPDVAPQFRPGAGTFSNRNQGPDSDATRLQPMNLGPREPDPTIVSPLEKGTPAVGVPMARPAAGMPAAWSSNAGPPSSPTVAGAPPAPPPPPNAAGYQAFGSVQVAVPGVPAPPQNMNQTLQAPMQSPLAGQPPPAYAMPPQMMPPQMMPPQPAGGPAPMPGQAGPSAETGRIQAPSELKGIDRVIAEWKAMPPFRKLIFGLFPGVVVLAWMMLFDNPAPQPQQQTQPVQSVPITTTTTTMTATAPTMTTTVTAPTMTTTTTAPTMTTTTTAPTTTAPATTTAPTATAPVPPPTPTKGRSLDRQAVDLALQGQFAKAAELYDQLAAQHPDQPAYKEAARLLRSRMSGN